MDNSSSCEEDLLQEVEQSDFAAAENGDTGTDDLYDHIEACDQGKVKPKHKKVDSSLEALEVEDVSVSNIISDILQQSIESKASDQTTDNAEQFSDSSNQENNTFDMGDYSAGSELDLSIVKPEVDRDSKVIVMNKNSRYNARIKPDTSNYKHKCTLCKEVFQWPHKLKKHMEIIHEGKYPFHCKVCKKPFDRKSGLTDHMITHTDARPYKCETCDKSFKFKGNLSKHVRETHRGEALQFQCEYCDKMFGAKEKLVAHFVIHNEEKKFVCGVCGKRFHRKNNLTEHQIVHSAEKKFECPECGLAFNRKYALKIHSRNHMAVKPYRCELCPSSFTQMHALKNHIRRHTGERPYKCSFCDRSFAQQSTLQVHTMRHTGEKNYECGVCHQKFVIKRRLQEHIRVHTGERPYQCELCPFKAAISSGLKYHMQNHMKRIQRALDVDGLELVNGELPASFIEDVSPREGVINDGDLRRNRPRKYKPPKSGVRRRRAEKQETEVKRKDKSVGTAVTKMVKNARKQKRRPGKEMDAVTDVLIGSDSPFRSPTLRAMLEGGLPSVDFSQFSNTEASQNFQVDRQLIIDSINKVMSAFPDENGDSIDNNSNSQVVENINNLQSNTPTTSNEDVQLPPSGEVELVELDSESEYEYDGSDTSENEDGEKAEGGFRVVLNEGYSDDSDTENDSNTEKESQYNYTLESSEHTPTVQEHDPDDDVIILD